MTTTQNSAELTDWLDATNQHLWFDQFKSSEANGLRFIQFQQFLQQTIYLHFKLFPIDIENNSKKQQDEECQFTRQQEMQLFKVFDINNDHVIDRDEFGCLCAKWLQSVYHPICGLVIVDVQNDFIDGSLALINGPAGQDGAEVVPVINNLIDKWQYYGQSASSSSSSPTATIVYTQDWHPPDHIGFHANLHMRKYTLKPNGRDTTGGNDKGDDRDNNNRLSASQQVHSEEKKSKTNETINNNNNPFKYKRFLTKAELFDTVLFDEGRVEQKLWPTHCVQNSWGAQLHPKLKQVPDAIRIQKGTLSQVDAYSAFWDNMCLNETGLRQELMAKRVTDLFFCGLALDFCVAASALDAAKAGFVTYVIEDACRGIDEHEIEARKRELLDNNVFIIHSDSVISYLLRQPQPQKATTMPNQPNMLNRDLVKTIAFRKALL